MSGGARYGRILFRFPKMPRIAPPAEMAGVTGYLNFAHCRRYNTDVRLGRILKWGGVFLICTLSAAMADGLKIALTFDDGPDKRLTPALLDILRENNARATFFPIGEKVPKYPDIISRIVREGHEIGNHGWGHLKMTRLGEAAARKEIRVTNAALEKTGGVTLRFFRPPHGLVDSNLRRIAYHEGGLRTVTWNLVCGDWEKVSSAHIEGQILKNVRHGSIILMHDTNPQTIAAMRRVIPKLRKKGYDMVTVSDLHDFGGLGEGGFPNR